MCVELTARLEHKLRKTICHTLPTSLSTKIYSSSRPYFLKAFFKQKPKSIAIPKELERTLWGIKFRSPVFNAAGMFKNGEAYELVKKQGAGAYLSGTSTSLPRNGNSPQAFIPYPESGAASNWLGLPNNGSKEVAATLAKLEKIEGCPIGASLSAAPEISDEKEKLERLVEDLLYYNDAKVDFIELNESCPNTEDEGAEEEFHKRLEHISKNFLTDNTPPVVIKLSNDTDVEQVPKIIDTLIELGFSGVNFGNTSTDYSGIKEKFSDKEIKLFDYFRNKYGGGVSGKPIRERSLSLVRESKQHLESKTMTREFHIIQTGGVFTAKDVQESLDAGASLVQWYTGYFEAFGERGNRLYQKLYEEIV